MKRLVIVILTFVITPALAEWGFFAHQKINRYAVFTLPPEMIGFYKHHIQWITENAVNPDKRRYVQEEEASRHYIDMEVYGDSALFNLPRSWKAAVEMYSEDTLKAYGIVPWYINLMRYRLTNAMRINDVNDILRLSADIGHYIADAQVPLHTTENYDGQLTGQRGIHGLWESRLPELYSEKYDFFVGKADYLHDPVNQVWNTIIESHQALDSVLFFEKEVSKSIGPDKKFTFETRGNTTVKTYSKVFSQQYHKRLNGMVERRMLKAVKMVGDFWYTCWIDAGQPDLNRLIHYEISEEELEQRRKELKVRYHE